MNAGIASLLIFAVTLFLMIRQPKKISIGVAAGIGAAASLLLGTVSLQDAAGAFLNIWDAALAFVGIVTLSITLDAMGFFRWAALKVALLARGSGVRLYFYITLLTAVVSILFANDSAVLILTPIVLEIIVMLGIEGKSRMAYLFGAGLVADTAAMPLITSNPVNIVSADFFNYTFIDHLSFMAPVAAATITLSVLVVYLFFRKNVRLSYSPEILRQLLGKETLISKPHLYISAAVLAMIDAGLMQGTYSHRLTESPFLSLYARAPSPYLRSIRLPQSLWKTASAQACHRSG